MLALAERAVALAEKLGDEPRLALTIRRKLGLPFLTSVPLTRLGQVALAEEDLDTAVAHVEALLPFLAEMP